MTDTSPPPFFPGLMAACLPLTDAKEVELRQRVITEALSWVGTPYRQQADVKGGGIDCSMLLVRAWVDAGVIAPFDPRPYPPNWHMTHSEERYLNWMSEVAVEVEHPQPGDVAMFQFGRCFSHSGILVNNTQMVHAWQGDMRCSTCDLHEAWLKYFDRSGKRLRPRRFFDVWARIRKESV